MTGPDRPAHALWFTGVRRAELRPAEVRRPRPGEVVVRCVASLISAGTELLIYRGETTPGELLPPTSEGTFPFPVKYGYQCVGRVEEAGEESGYEVGQRVFARHPHQDLFTIRADPTLLTRLPDQVDDEAATFINLTRVALTALLDAPVRVGETAVVFGQGIVGIMCARLARLTAARVVVVDRLPARRELALRYGADAAVAPEDARRVVDDLSHGRGADVTIEASGAPAALQSAIEVTGPDGQIVVLSYYGTRQVQLRLAPEFHFRRHRIVSSQAGTQVRWDWARRTEATIELLSRMSVADMVSARIPFSDAPRGYELLDRQPEQALGVILDYRRRSG
jgi:2-desacetyl-2-hydroxyethyl bacteriochlorophyllide A dehydrogenase